jgi:hypothetical protein
MAQYNASRAYETQPSLCYPANGDDELGVVTASGIISEPSHLLCLTSEQRGFITYIVATDPKDQKDYSFGIRYICHTHGAEDLISRIQKQRLLKHKKSLCGRLCGWCAPANTEDTAGWQRCPLGRNCPDIHVEAMGYNLRRLWFRGNAKQSKKLSATVNSAEVNLPPSDSTLSLSTSRTTHQPYLEVFSHGGISQLSSPEYVDERSSYIDPLQYSPFSLASNQPGFSGPYPEAVANPVSSPHQNPAQLSTRQPFLGGSVREPSNYSYSSRVNTGLTAIEQARQYSTQGVASHLGRSSYIQPNKAWNPFPNYQCTNTAYQPGPANCNPYQVMPPSAFQSSSPAPVPLVKIIPEMNYADFNQGDMNFQSLSLGKHYVDKQGMSRHLPSAFAAASKYLHSIPATEA